MYTTQCISVNGGCQSDRQRIVDEIERNRMERMMRRKYQRHLATQQFYKSMQMLQTNARPDPTPFEDYSLFVYRQTAPAFEDRVKDMEKKILYPVRLLQRVEWPAT
ncbi:hypothetical protein PR048_031820 [Dryococelus australis]|uniref:Uncharacterized protein n=1 Tax=Dryococelus australis TaxID=614101 RepID=A0ABQ9G6E1_9NEOP|nr:hypothetical protein PR048_031820 [Dryococelus australis]